MRSSERGIVAEALEKKAIAEVGHRALVVVDAGELRCSRCDVAVLVLSSGQN